MSERTPIAHVAILLVLRKGDEVLFGRRCNTWSGNGDYGPFGGHADGGESASAAMARETAEELGISVDPSDLKLVHTQHLKLPPREYTNYFFETDTWRGEPRIMEPDKCDDMRWFRLDDLPESMSPNIRHAIEEYKKGNMYSEFGWN